MPVNGCLSKHYFESAIVSVCGVHSCYWRLYGGLELNELYSVVMVHVALAQYDGHAYWMAMLVAAVCIPLYV